MGGRRGGRVQNGRITLLGSWLELEGGGGGGGRGGERGGVLK